MQAIEQKAAPVLTILRNATRARHDALEAGSDIEARLRDAATRPDMVARFLDLHERVEAIADGHLALVATLGCVLPGRVGLIRGDLVRLGVVPRPPVPVPPADTLGEALGGLYVVEGSMLGGRVMRRAMTGDGVDLTGLDFLDPHRQDTGSRWRAFLAVMEEACASGQARRDDIVTGADHAFALAARILAPEQPMRMTA